MTIEEFIEARLNEDAPHATEGRPYLELVARRASLCFYAQLGTENDRQKYVDIVLGPMAEIWSDHPDYQQEWTQ